MLVAAVVMLNLSWRGSRPIRRLACMSARPTMDDVERISWGKPAKQKGVGSRGVPHRLNDDEREEFDRARRKGFVEIGGSGWRRERADAPLCNTWRQWCDARATAAISLHKSRDGVADCVVVDLSPLRIEPEALAETTAACLVNVAGAADGRLPAPAAALEGDEYDDEVTAKGFPAIWRYPRYDIEWARARPEAKALAKALAAHFGTVSTAPKGRGKKRGAPDVAPGKSRRHGGYGIG